VEAPIDVRHYGTAGCAVAVLHGGPGAPGGVATLAARLGDEFQVSEPLQRRADGRPLTVERHVEDLTAVVTEPVALIGWSWGAMLGLSFAARHPEAVRSLVLVGCGTYDEATRAEYQRRFNDRLGKDGRRRMDELRDELARATGRDEKDRLIEARGTLAEGAQSFELVPAAGPPRLRTDAIGHGETWTDVLRLQAERREPKEFETIRAPVLMLHGENDPHPGSATRDLLRLHLPQLEYVEFPQCGHTPWLERHAREPFLAELRRWLRSAP
jgi:pimeloyl-ACP methyl ester carboxylesterase